MAAQQQDNDHPLPDALEFSRTLARTAEQSQRLVSRFLHNQAIDGHLGAADVADIGNAFLQMTQALMTDPLKTVETQVAFWRSHAEFWQKSAVVLFGLPVEALIEPGPEDRRFDHKDWRDNYFFNFIKQSYLLTARWLQTSVGGVEGIDPKTKKRLEFYTRQFVEALAPSNFPVTNPEVIQATLETKGANLLRGLSNLLQDLERSRGKLIMPPAAGSECFRLGESIATTPSKVVFQNDLFQLLQYAPSTGKVFRRPLLVVPSWLNKFYVLDLRPENSLIRWWVDRGFTVFVISWVNPDEKTADRGFDDYLVEGPVAALEAIEKITGTGEVNTVGYCLGGTLLACASAFLEARAERRIVSSTYLTTMLDFSQPGDLEIFIDEEQLSALLYPTDPHAVSRGQGAALACCSLLRANDLVWSFFINSYLLGKGPFPLDILYWNSDFSNVPSRMHGFYLRHMYQLNLLREPGAITLAGQPIDLRAITSPAYFLSAVEDHLAPWKSTYAGGRLLSGEVRFVLSGAGHVASVIDSSGRGESCYWTNSRFPEHAGDWFEGAEKHEGGWCSDWLAWIGAHAGKMVPARVPGANGLAVIEDGPGAYVRTRASR